MAADTIKTAIRMDANVNGALPAAAGQSAATARSPRTSSAAINTPIQGGAANIMTLAMLKLQPLSASTRLQACYDSRWSSWRTRDTPSPRTRLSPAGAAV